MLLPSIDSFLYLVTGDNTFVSLIKAAEVKLGVKIGMDNKTLKKAIKKVKNTPQTQDKLETFFLKIIEETGASQSYSALIDKHNSSGPVYSYWSFWLSVSEYTDDNFPLWLYPETRQLIRDLAYWERDKTAIAQERYSSIWDRLRFFADDESRNKWIPDTIRQSFLDNIPCDTAIQETESYQTNMHFKLWVSHTCISSILRIFAYFDVEYTITILEKNKIQESPRTISFIESLLPRKDEQNIILPVKRLFEIWRDNLVCKGKIKKNWRDFAKYINGGDIRNRKRILDRWRSGMHTPSEPHIKGLLKNIQAVDEDVDWNDEYKWFCVALIFQRLYQSLEKEFPELPQEDLLLHFESYRFHRKAALEIHNL